MGLFDVTGTLAESDAQERLKFAMENDGDGATRLRTKSTPPAIEYIRSDKDTDFTGAIAQDAQEQGNITGLSRNKGTIESISIQSDQNLEWDVFLFVSDTFENTDLDLDRFVEFANFPVSSGKQIAGANQFYYSLTGLGIPYRDEDSSLELHIALVNRSATAKNAGATGEITITVGFRPDSE